MIETEGTLNIITEGTLGIETELIKKLIELIDQVINKYTIQRGGVDESHAAGALYTVRVVH